VKKAEMLLKFFADLEGKVKGLKGYIMMNNVNDAQESLVLTFWETKVDMNTFYQPSNKVFRGFC
jgi:heme-degrading monooxygenase HmoA